MHPLLRVLVGIAIIGSSCFATFFVKLAVDMLRFGTASVLGVGAPLPDDPYYYFWVVAGLTVGVVLTAKVTGGKRK